MKRQGSLSQHFLGQDENLELHKKTEIKTCIYETY